ncbi:MAG: J domain-containing protein [Desulfobacteraceae bacterium]|nr:MAG: J domain-containing protein [Desulfobacteraceae bacterium]
MLNQEILNAYNVIFGSSVGTSVDILRHLHPSALKTAYRRKALETHPDRSLIVGKMENEMNGCFVEVTLAYEILQSALKNLHSNGAGYNDHIRRVFGRRTTDTVNLNNASDLYYRGRIPKHRLLIGQFLYYSGIVSWGRLIEAISWQKRQRPPIGQIAMKWGILSEYDIQAILKQRSLERNFHKRFGEYARLKGYITSYELLALLGKQRMFHRPIGEYFIEKRILPADNMDKMLERLRNHNRLVSKGI